MAMICARGGRECTGCTYCYDDLPFTDLEKEDIWEYDPEEMEW